MKKALTLLLCALLSLSCLAAFADGAENPVVRIRVANAGDIYAELYPDIAPITVENFLSLVDRGFYDGLTFHRIISGFMIQGGDPKGNGTGGSDKTIKGEFSANGVQNDLKHARGVLSMARSSDMDSASSQFFIMHADASHLDGSYAAFGRVLAGIGVVDRLCMTTAVADGNGTVAAGHAPVIESIVRVDRSEALEAMEKEAANGASGSAFTEPGSGITFTVPEGWSLTQCANGYAVFSPSDGSNAVIRLMALDIYTYWAGITGADAAAIGVSREAIATSFFNKANFMSILSITDESLLVESERAGHSFYRAETQSGSGSVVDIAGAENGVIYTLESPAGYSGVLDAILDTLVIP